MIDYACEDFSMTGSIVASIAAMVLASAVLFVVRNWVWIGCLPRCLVIERSRRLRISISVLLRISGESGYFLIRMPRRPEAFGPMGGVLKFHLSARGDLLAMGFASQHEGAELGDDLRGFIPASNVLQFWQWFRKEADRESVSDCLRRELREELREVDADLLVPQVDHLRFKLLRTIREGPKSPGAAYPYLQFRMFYIYDLPPDESLNREFVGRLMTVAEKNSNFLIASVEEINKGRTPKGIIGSHACYLLSQRLTRPDLPPFS